MNKVLGLSPNINIVLIQIHSIWHEHPLQWKPSSTSCSSVWFMILGSREIMKVGIFLSPTVLRTGATYISIISHHLVIGRYYRYWTLMRHEMSILICLVQYKLGLSCALSFFRTRSTSSLARVKSLKLFKPIYVKLSAIWT